jgi:transposase
MKKTVIGIDVSKEKLDVCILNETKVQEEAIIENQTKKITIYLKEIQKKYTPEEILICAEYTGQYTYPLSIVCEEMQIALWIENPAQIKYRSGVQRGKNDKLDARKIAQYAERFQEEAKLFNMPEKSMVSLKQLISERDMYVSDRAKYQGQLTDQERFMDKADYKKKSKRLQALIQELDEAIKQIEKEIQKIIDSDETLSNQHKLLCSIEGIGERTAVKMIVETNAFKDFTNPRKFCCHAGVAPFSYTSGSSQHSRNKVSNRADKSIKALLHMAALIAATRMHGELHDYYLRKVGEGKNKMSVLNAVRAKLVYRMFAVIKNNQIYQKNYLNPLLKS